LQQADRPSNPLQQFSNSKLATLLTFIEAPIKVPKFVGLSFFSQFVPGSFILMLTLESVRKYNLSYLQRHKINLRRSLHSQPCALEWRLNVAVHSSLIRRTGQWLTSSA